MLLDMNDPKKLEELLKRYGGATNVTNIMDGDGQKFQTVFLALQAVRLREQSRNTMRMVFFVGVASFAQVVTLVLALFAID